MGASPLFLLRTLLLLSVVCAVLCDHAPGDNRRIIIKDKGSRGHKKGGQGHGHHGRGHTRSQRHSGRGQGHGRKNKGKKQKFSSEEDGSIDDSDSSFSQESYEEKHHNQVRKPYRQPKTPRLRPSQSLDYDPFRNEPYREDSTLHYHSDWTPMSSELKHRFTSYEDPRYKRNKRKDGRPRRDYVQALRPPPVELTTSYPIQYDTPSIIPQMNAFVNPFTNWNFNQKLFQSNTPLIGTIEQPNLQLEESPDRLKNHRTSFEEADTNLNTFISVPDDTELVVSKEEEEEPKSTLRVRTTEKTTTTTTRPTRSRGRANYRGYKKH